MLRGYLGGTCSVGEPSRVHAWLLPWLAVARRRPQRPAGLCSRCSAGPDAAAAQTQRRPRCSQHTTCSTSTGHDRPCSKAPPACLLRGRHRPRSASPTLRTRQFAGTCAGTSPPLPSTAARPRASTPRDQIHVFCRATLQPRRRAAPGRPSTASFAPGFPSHAASPGLGSRPSRAVRPAALALPRRRREAPGPLASPPPLLRGRGRGLFPLPASGSRTSRHPRAPQGTPYGALTRLDAP